MQIVVDELRVRRYRLPLKVSDRHFLAGAVIGAAKHVNRVIVVLGAMEKSAVGHGSQFHELESFDVENHCIFCACTVVVTPENDNLVATN